MAFEVTATNRQIIPAGQSAVFTAVVVPCRRGLVQFRLGTGNLELSGRGCNVVTGCPCCRPNTVNYKATFSGNIAVPEGGTAETISVGITVNGEVLQDSIMQSTPAAVEQFNAVSKTLTIPILKGCCQSVTVENNSTQDIALQNAILDIDYLGVV